MSHRELSVKITKGLDKTTKKKGGIYFTPKTTVEHNLKLLEPHLRTTKTVLEPSCGSCEFVMSINEKYPKAKITAIENNKRIYDDVKHLSEDANIDVYHQDFLKWQTSQKFDLIIGNPPYFVMKKGDVEKSYHDYYEGRPNIFIMFIIKSLGLLTKSGILSFVLPKSFLNSSYYNKTRKFIYQRYKIIDIVECQDNYIDTKQQTVIVIIQNRTPPKSCQMVLEMGNQYIFGTKDTISKLKPLLHNSTTLKELGFEVKVGTVIWNEHKDILTDDTSKTRLIYSSDIANHTLVTKKYKNCQKRNFINKIGQNGPLLVINRGYGVGSYKFEYCVVDIEGEYLIENHLICIRHTSCKEPELLRELYEKITKSFRDNRTGLFIKLYFGNNAINTTEINTILPIYF